ncbi:MAG: hypothetical protein F4138_00825 [Acidimicrobiia bacterium]|nr:hypothetical protein [Acidimicrobiia bacterium]
MAASSPKTADDQRSIIRPFSSPGTHLPDDEHQGRGDAIRAARTQGMRTADQKRRAWHRSQK